jgi:uncharacterized coiled-coil protein SlyX
MSLGGVAVAGSIEDELAAIKARIAALEQQVADQNRVINEKDRQIQALTVDTERSQVARGDHWTDRVEIGGLVEVEAGYHSSYDGDETSDLAVATVELGIAAQVNDWVAAEITLLYEEDDTDLEVDVATITVAPPDGPWFATAGQQYVPFGVYGTNLVSDPLTLEIGETRETAALVGIEANGFVGSAYVFNGDSDKDDEIDRYGLMAGYASEGDDFGFALQAGYISHIGDSDGLDVGDVGDYVGGIALDAQITAGAFTFIAGYVAATDSFDAAELGFNGKGAEPKAWAIEAGYAFELASRPAMVALGFQGTEEALALELPEQRIAVALSVEVMDNTTLSFEWARDEDYGTSDGGTGKTADTATAQLAVAF